ncbi:MAG: DNA adenine methylase [Oscillatoriales cyanobacterium C42_A2020_001]|nr:DNA adenine methylase [Leptolyngbyaceae cyanobacterium C42_A2020_001]
MIKSPLRYPGGKSRAIPQIINYLPAAFSDYREPFLGGGSLFIHLKQKRKDLRFWVNDLNYDLFLFWHCAQSRLSDLVSGIREIKNHYKNGRELFAKLTHDSTQDLSELERAIRFFVLNRITFSGTVESGGYSEEAFHKRFTESSIERLSRLENLLNGVMITNLDYSDLLKVSGDNVFLFLDPPYLSVRKSKLYGKKGDLHTSFDHDRFAELLKNCNHQWLVTYDDCPEIREKFQFAYLYEWQLQYGMNNYKQIRAAKGKELFITNYAVDHERCADGNLNLSSQLVLDFAQSSSSLSL